MSTTIGDATVRILPDMRRFAAQMRAQMRAATAGTTRDMRRVGTTMGRDLGDGFVRGADGRLRDAQGRFAAAGAQISRQMQGDMQRAGAAVTTSIVPPVQAAGRQFQQTGQQMADAGQTMTKSVTAPLAAIGATSITVSGDFEAAMNGVRAVSGATGKNFTQLRDLAKRMGSTTQFSAVEAANAMEFLGMAGFKTTDIMAALPDVLNLAAAGNTDLATTADIASNIMSGFGIEAREMARVADVMAATAAGANVDMRMLGESMKYAAPLAKAAGWSFEDTAAAVGFLGNAGIQGSMAGTGLNSVLATLSDTSSTGGKRLKEFGVAATGSNGKVRPLVDIIEDLSKKGADVADVISIFGLEAGPKLQALIGQGAKGLREFAKDLKNSEGAAKEMADIRMEGFVGQVKSLQSAFQGLMIEIGDAGLLDWATDFAQRLTNLISGLAQTNPALLRIGSIIAIVAAVAGPALAALGFAITGISTALGVLLGPVGLVIAAVVALGAAFVLAWRYSSDFRDGVRSLSAMVQTFAVAAFAELRTIVDTHLLPALRRAGQLVVQDVLPALRTLVGHVRTTLLPAVAGLWKTLTTKLLPAWRELAEAIASRAIPIVRKLAEIWTGVLAPAAMKIYSILANSVQPVLVAIADFIRGRVVPAVKMIGDRLRELVAKAEPVIRVVADVAVWLARVAGTIIRTVVPWIVRLAGPVFSALFKAIGIAIKVLGTLIGWLVTVGRALVTLGRWVMWLWDKAIKPAFKFIGQAARILATILLVVMIGPIFLGVKALGAIFGWLWRSAIKPVFDAIGKLARWLWQSVFRPVFQAIQALIRALAAAFRWLYSSVIQPVFRVIAGVIRSWWAGIRATFRAVVSFLRGPLGAVFRWLRDNVIRPVFSAIRSAISTVWQRGIRPVFNALRTAVGKVADAFRSARDGIRRAWNQLKSIAKGPVNFVIRTVYNDGIRKVWNAVVGAFGGTKLDAVPALARGGILPGTSSFRQGDDQLVSMRRGEGVYVSEAMRDPYERARLYAVNRAAMAGRPLGPFQGGFALGGIFDGIGNVASSAWDKIKKGASWLKDTFGGAIKAGVKAIINPLINLIPGRGRFPGLLRSGARKFVDKLLGAGEKGDKEAGPNVRYSPSKGVEQWRPVVLQSLRKIGQSEALANTTLRRLNQESGGNPRAVNKWDMNWHAGHPSVGLMQVIRPTFQRWAGSYRGTGPFMYGVSINPLANIYSSMRYALGTYGSLSRAYNRPGGYDQGGVIQRGLTSVMNNTGRPEALLTGPQWQAVYQGSQAAAQIAALLASGRARPVQPIVQNIRLENRGVIGSQRELDDWLAGSLDRLRRRHRMPAGAGGR
jgi:TP901 family phage tail tape measure protein